MGWTGVTGVAQIQRHVRAVHCKSGYATASTDTGRLASQSSGSLALNSDASLNWPEITDLTYRGIHEMTVEPRRRQGGRLPGDCRAPGRA